MPFVSRVCHSSNSAAALRRACSTCSAGGALARIQIRACQRPALSQRAWCTGHVEGWASQPERRLVRLLAPPRLAYSYAYASVPRCCQSSWSQASAMARLPRHGRMTSVGRPRGENPKRMPVTPSSPCRVGHMPRFVTESILNRRIEHKASYLRECLGPQCTTCLQTSARTCACPELTWSPSSLAPVELLLLSSLAPVELLPMGNEAILWRTNPTVGDGPREEGTSSLGVRSYSLPRQIHPSLRPPHRRSPIQSSNRCRLSRPETWQEQQSRHWRLADGSR
mmetsp:Transcript_1518/g.3768  ORF Transcript_1518/g.3768 Transcript_1518/m.3768 type:complete len:281 (-) Transcript_1518:487-1329(-)